MAFNAQAILIKLSSFANAPQYIGLNDHNDGSLPNALCQQSMRAVLLQTNAVILQIVSWLDISYAARAL